MFFVLKKYMLLLFRCFFQYIDPPDVRRPTFGAGGTGPDQAEETALPLANGSRRSRSSFTRNGTTDDVRSINNVPIATVSLNERYNQLIYPHDLTPTASQSFPYLPNTPSPSLIQPVMSRQHPEFSRDLANSVSSDSINVSAIYGISAPTFSGLSIPMADALYPSAPQMPLHSAMFPPHQSGTPFFRAPFPPAVGPSSVRHAPMTSASLHNLPLAAHNPQLPHASVSHSVTAVDPDAARRERDRKRKQDERARKSAEAKKKQNEINAAAMRQSRANRTQEEAQSQREQNAAAMQQSRANRTQEEAQSQREQNAAAMQQSRANRTQEEAQSQREQNAAAMQHSRANATDEQRQSQRAQNTAARQLSRVNGTEEERQSQRARNTSAVRRARADLSPEEQERRRAADRDAHRDRRQQMTPAELAVVNQRRRNNYQRRQQEQRDRTTLAAVLIQRPSLHTLGQMNIPCRNCGALYFAGECARSAEGTYDRCCNHSKVAVPLFEDFPLLLKDLFTRNHPESQNFHSHIRNFNSSLAMASMETQLKTMGGGGPFVYCVHGQINYHAGPAMPQHSSPSFGQLYFIDSAQAADERIGRSSNSSCSPNVMRQLSHVMSSDNRLARAYKKMGDVYREEEAKARAEDRDIPKIKMVFVNKKTTDPRRYNDPAANEVALIYVGPDGDVPQPREYTVFLQGGGFAKLTVKNKMLDAMLYPLFFPDGRDSWHPDLTKQNAAGFQRTRITQANFYRYLLSVRNSFNPIHWGGKLFQQLAVDLWIRMESNSLEWVRHNQSKVRAECYQSLRDFVADGETGLAGSRVVLPSSHTGSPRHYAQEFQDTMCMVGRYGKPDLFITVTTNPNWVEITDSLLPGQCANDRPDIVTRVFNEKFAEILKDITVDHVLGEVVAFAHTIEWQKRGLPHAHLLVTLAPRHKLETADAVDQIISAEIPDETETPELYNLVKTHMIHRKCGTNNLHAPCTKNGKCSKNFPKPYTNQTTLENGKYPEYRRRDDGRRITIGTGSNAQTYDNRHIVSYSKYFLAKYNCHLNVEVCSLIHVCKYLYKYVYKGVDKAVIQLRKQMRLANGGIIDEIDEHLDCRYMCPPEAVHRIFKYKISARSHSIERLDVHLPDFQNVNFIPGQEQQALAQAAQTKTTLQAYFELIQAWNEKAERGEDLGPTDPRSLCYLEIPEHFVFEKTPANYHWKQRSVGGDKKIGRLMGVIVADKERYSLRKLLLERKGCASFAELRTLNGHRFPTFEAAAMSMGLLHANDAFSATMHEACHSEMPYQLRRLFVSLFIFYMPSSTTSLALWEHFADDMSEDYAQRGRRSTIEAHALSWYEIADALSVQNIAFETFVPPPLPHRPSLNIQDRQVDHHGIASEMRSKLNREQEIVTAEILSNAGSNLIFVDGPGGSGKTFMYECIYHTFKADGKNVVCCAWTGIAASILPEGRTISSLFKLNKKNNNKTSSVKPNSKDGRILRDIDIIIVDEVSMVSSWCLEGIDMCLKDVCNNDLPFGGKKMLMGGDFRQVLPIPPRNSGIEASQICLKNTHLFDLFAKFSLATNMRASSETAEWKNFLMSIGNGTAALDENETVEFPSDLLSQGDLINEVFEGVLNDGEHLRRRAILCPRNYRVDEINNDVLELMDSQEMTYYGCDSIDQDAEEDQLEIDPEFLHQQTPRGFPLYRLRLKIGAVVMVMRNLNIKEGLCNGTRLQIVKFANNFISCKFIVGPRQGEQVLIPRIELLSDDDTLAFKLRRRQFPLRLAFAMTINKSQGQSLDRVGIDLENSIFGHGQLYVALSRSTTKSGVKIYTNNNIPKAKNIVDKRVL